MLDFIPKENIEFIEVDGKRYKTDRETVELLDTAHQEGADTIAFAVFTLGLQSGRIVEITPDEVKA